MQWNELKAHIRQFSVAEQDRIQMAFELGKRMHGDQKRRSGEAYFNHPIAVAHMLADLGADADTVIAALLHDTVEDTPLTLPEIERAFGKDVHALIEGVTKLSKADVGEQPNLDEQIETLRKIFTLMEKDIRIMVIKLVDRLHNMQTVEFLPPEKQRALAKETMEVYVKIADRLCMQDQRDELEALCLCVLEPDVYERLSTLRSENEKQGGKIVADMQKRLEMNFPQHTSDVHMHYEHKSWENLREQLLVEGTAVTGVSGISIAFVCEQVDTCYRVMGALHQMWQRELMSFQDFINAPAVNGYRGLHTTIILENGTRVRCKIRTQQMQEYARQGITSVCFRPDSSGLHAQLPWTQRITSLSLDTKGRSLDFWGSLQSDILGDSIVIHGPADQAVLVPKGSTALDGAFYLFGPDAIRTKSILIRGREVPFDTRLEHAMSLNVVLAESSTADRRWLEQAHTGYTMAAIRTALAQHMSEKEKIELGKDLLQRVLTEKKKGFIEEFDPKKLEEKLRESGYVSLQETYLAIADGRIDPATLYWTVFGTSRNANGKNEGKQKCVVTFSVDKNNFDALRRLLEVYQKYSVQFKNVKMWTPAGSTRNQFSFVLDLSSAEQAQFQADIRQVGASSIEIVVRSKREWALIAAVIFPWALNPVIAKWLLTHGMQPMPLITIRLLTFSVFTMVLFAIWRIVTKTTFTPISNVTLRAALPTLGNAGLSLFTYWALLFMPPSVHLTILRFNTFLIPSLQRRSKSRNGTFLLFLLLLTCAIGLLLISLGLSYFMGIALSVISLLFYTFYSLSTERSLHQHKIDVRHPYLLFHMGIQLGILGAIMLAFQSLSSLWNPLSIPAFFYVLLCVCLPHAAYSALLKTTRFKHFTDLLLIEVPIAMLFEAGMLGIVLSPFTYGAVGCIIALLLLLRWEKLQMRM